MFNRIIAWSLHNRLLVLCLTLVACLLGGFAVTRMPVDVFPEFAPPQIVIQTEAPGIAPLDVENLITYPLESSINGTPGVSTVRSKSWAGLSVITVIFDDKTDVFLDRQLINEKIQLASARLPPGTKSPTMLPVTSAVGWLIKYALTSKTLSPEQLRTFSDWDIRPKILALGGIASVQSLGGEVKQYQVLIDPKKLFAYNISLASVRDAVLKANQNVPGAFLQQTGQELTINALGRIQTLNDIKNTVIITRDGIPITLGNIAVIQIGGAIKRGDAAYGLDNAVIGTITKAYGADTLTTTYKIEKTLASIKKNLPAGVELQTQVFRQANFIESAIQNLSFAFLKGALIVAIILFVFLVNWRASFITFLSMPVSFIIGILILHAFNIGINAMVLGGLVIAIGEVVDDGIITVENVVRRLRLNRLSAKPAATIEIIFDAVLEIRNSVVYATLIVCMVFLPIFFLQGIANRIFTPLGIAYINSVLASLVVSITLVPTLCYLLLVRPQEKQNDSEVQLHTMGSAELIRATTPTHVGSLADEKEPRLVHLLKKHFLKVLHLTIKYPLWLIGIALVSLLLAFSLLPFFGRSFLPEFHEGNFIIAMTTLPGTSLAESMRLGQQVRTDLLKYPQVVSIAQRAGRSELDDDALPPNFSEFDVTLNFDTGSQLRPDKLIKQIRSDLSQIPGVAFNVGQFISHRMDEILSGVRSQVAVKIFGENLSTLNELGTEVTAILKNIPGIVDINKEQQINVPQLVIQINRQKAARYGINIGDVGEVIQLYLNGESLSNIVEGTKSFELVVRVNAENRHDIRAIQNLLIDAPTLNTKNNLIKIPLRAIADIAIKEQPFSITRENVRRLTVVAFNVEGRDLGSVINDVQTNIKEKISLPLGYSIEYGGQFETQQQANRTLMLFGGLILLITIMLLYKVFGTLREVALVLLNIPFALIGGIVALFIAGANFSVAAMIGFITLFGITLRNGIILVSHYHQLQKEGLLLQEVVISGTLDRLLPVLMTASTAALALLPLLFGSPAGKELERPLAQVLLGGLITSTTLNLLVIPTIYYHLENRRQLKNAT